MARVGSTATDAAPPVKEPSHRRSSADYAHLHLPSLTLPLESAMSAATKPFPKLRLQDSVMTRSNSSTRREESSSRSHSLSRRSDAPTRREESSSRRSTSSGSERSTRSGSWSLKPVFARLRSRSRRRGSTATDPTARDAETPALEGGGGSTDSSELCIYSDRIALLHQVERSLSEENPDPDVHELVLEASRAFLGPHLHESLASATQGLASAAQGLVSAVGLEDDIAISTPDFDDRQEYRKALALQIRLLEHEESSRCVPIRAE